MSGEKVLAIEGGPIAVTVSESVLLVSSPSLITSSGSTVAVFARSPAAVGVTPIVTANAPVVAPIVTVAPLASQVSTLLPSIEQLIFPELVTLVMLPTEGAPYVAPEGSGSRTIVSVSANAAARGPGLLIVIVQL